MLLGGLFSRKQSAEPAPNPERDAFFDKQFKAAEAAIREKYKPQITRSGDQIRYARYSGIDLERKAADGEAMTKELKELAKAAARPPIVIDIENRPLMRKALGEIGDAIKTVALGGPENNDMYIELAKANSVDIPPAGITPQKNDGNKEKPHPETIRVDLAPVLAFALKRDGDKVILTPAGDRETGITVSKPYTPQDWTGWAASFLDYERYDTGKLTHLTLSPSEDGKSHTADASVASNLTGGYLSISKKDLPIESAMYAKANLAAVFLLNIVGGNNGTKIADSRANPKPSDKVID